MNLARLLTIFVVVGGASSALAQTTTVDFDTFPDGTAVPSGTEITTQYNGVTFSTSAGVCLADRFARLSAPNALHCDSALGEARGDMELRFDFAMQRVDFVARGVGNNDLTLTALNAAGVAVDSEMLTGTGSGSGASTDISLTGVGIMRVEIRQPNNISTDGYAIDDLEFERMSVVAVCGNNIMEAGEACDDGNVLGCDTCAADCSAVTDAGCLVAGTCFRDGAASPGNACQVCDADANGFAFSNVANGDACDDGLFCTTADSCQAGLCTGAALDCGDGLACTVDACDDVADSCVNALQADSCLIAGVCVAGAALDPTNQCLACNPAESTTTFTNVTNGTACNDGAFCTETDSCTEGLCGGSVRDCSDGLSCTLDTCDEVADVCTNDLTATSCTIDGMCVADGALDPSNPCMACNAATDMNAYTPVMDGTACDDGAFCTEVDSCTAGTCGGTARTCDDALDCTADSCAEAIGECVNVLDGGCLIDGECIAEDTVDADNVCQMCDPDIATTEYSPVADGTLCSDPTCTDRTITPASSCMSATCVAADPMACPDGVACEDGNVCAGGCTSDAQCLSDDFCNADGMCVPDVDNGEDCDRANQCGSGFCAADDGVCCDTSCSGLCQGCGTGACTAYAAGTDPENECGAEMCNGSAMCEAPMGSDAGPGADAGAGDSGPDVDADVGGSVTGGACAATPGAGGTSLPLLGLGLLGLIIRRRRR